MQAEFYVRVFAAVVEALGLILTGWRVYFRIKIGRFWWEDAWAVILLVTGVIWLIAWWIHLNSHGTTSIVASWMNSIGFTCVVTQARMSILFSVIRIIHGRPRLLRFSYACVAFFAACWTIIIVEKVQLCVSTDRWHRASTYGPSCLLKPYITIFQFASDCITVSILVVIPLVMLWRVKLPRRQRRMILSIFASSVVIAFGALLHTTGQILNNSIVLTVGMHAKAALSIVVCNLLVVVTYSYKFLLRRDVGSDMITGSTEDTSNDDDFTTRPRSTTVETTLSLTTFDLSTESSTSPWTGVETGSVPTQMSFVGTCPTL